MTRWCVLRAVACLALLAPTVARAAAFSYADFSDVSLLTLNGDATQVGSVLRLTDTYFDAGSIFRTGAVALGADYSFNTEFSFRFTDPKGAGGDGMVFVVHTNVDGATALRGDGGQMGYYLLTESVGVEFDTWDNDNVTDVNDNSLGIRLSGDLETIASVAVADAMDLGDTFWAWIDYDGATQVMDVYLAKGSSVKPGSPLLSSNVDVGAELGGTTAWMGFTAGTGGASNDHELLSWSFSSPDAQHPGSIPEPGSLALLGLGLTALVRRRLAA